MTNNELTTPERIPAKHTQLPKGWKLIRREDGEDVIMHPEAGAVGRMSFGDDFVAALQAEGMGEINGDPKDLNFLHGVAIALANLVRMHDQPGMAADVMQGMGISYDDLKKAGVDEYDLKDLR